MKVTRVLASLVTGVLVCAGGDALSLSSAQAAPISQSKTSNSSAAQAAQCKAGATRIRWSKVNRPYALVGSTTITLPAHAAYSQEVTAERTSTYTGKVSASTKVSAKFKVKLIGELSANVGFNLEKEKSSTEKISMTKKFSIPAADTQQKFAFFFGVRRGGGNWVYERCSYTNPTFTSTAWYYQSKGKASSWRGGYEGAINCAVKQKKGSMEALVRSQAC